MHYLIFGFILVSSSCHSVFPGSVGRAVISENDISGQKQFEFESRFSSQGRLPSQLLRISVTGKDGEAINLSKDITAEVYVEYLSGENPVRVSVNDFIAKEYESIELKVGQNQKIHRDIFRQHSGYNYLSIKMSQLTAKQSNLQFRVAFSKPMPEHSVVITQVFWSDGP
jgi:hypothetical protein